MSPTQTPPAETRRSTGRWLLGAVVAASALATAWWALAPTAAPLSDGPEVAQDLAGQEPEVRKVLAQLPVTHLQRAAQGVYQFHAELEVATSTSGAEQARTVVVDAELALGTEAASAAAGWTRGQLRQLRVSGDATLQKELGFDQLPSRPLDYAFRTEPHGDSAELRYDAALPAGVRNVLHAATTGLQVTGTPTARGWTSIERSTDSELDLAYTQDNDGTIRKRWNRPATDRGGPTGSGEATLRHDFEGLRYASYQYDLAVDLSLHASVPQTQRVAAKITLDRQSAGQALKATPPLEALAAEKQLESASQRPRQRPKPSGRTVSALVQDATAAGVSRDWAGRKLASEELKDQVGHNADALAELLTALRQPGLDGEGLRTLVEALAYANTDIGRTAYATAMQAPDMPYMARHALVSAATFVAEPTPVVLDALRAIFTTKGHELQAAAALAFAALARTQSERNPALGLPLKAEVLERASKWLAGPDAPKPDILPETLGYDERDLWLEALGNLGGPEAWPLIQPYLVAQSDWMRLHAIESLRFVQVPAARVALAKAMLLDPRGRNRRKATEIAAYHPRSAMQEPVVRALREDPDAVVRIGAATTVATWGITSPALNLEVEAAAAREQNSDVKRILVGLKPELLPDTTGGHP